MLDLQKPYFFFETNKFDIYNYKSYYFFDPVKTLKLDDPLNLDDFFLELEMLSKEYYLAGFFSYELGYFLEDAFNCDPKTDYPYAFFGAYKQPAVYDHYEKKFISGRINIPDDHGEYNISNMKLTVDEPEYKKNIEIIRDYIRKGDVYQANYTIKYNFEFSGSPFSLYTDLKRKQNVAYNAYAGFEDYIIISLSPELFFHKKNNQMIVKPMKGTYKRGRNFQEDFTNRGFLANDEKNKSENVMIVDLLRNDIGKISRGGSVKVTKLFEVEKYNTLFQMTSTIESVLDKNLSIYDIIKSIFPSGSITGAPKIRSMEILKDLEKEDRKIYTGALGFFEPSGEAIFNVAIRTLLIQGSRGEMGIGGGIVYDSTPDGEFQECKLKANFLLKNPLKEFSLIETMLLENNKYDNPGLHIQRMSDSAEYFDYELSREHLLDELERLKERISIDNDNLRYKVRILLDRFGYFIITHTELTESWSDYRITFSNQRTDSDDIFLFHKTTNRALYENELKKARENGFFDVVFLNFKDELTEGAISNIYVKQQNKLFTPPINSGLLNGTVRERLIKNGEVTEKVIYLRDIKEADEIFISNSIIGFQKAVCII